jgi:hypothetical protein
LWGLPIALIPLFPWEATALILLACVGFGNALVDVGLFTLMARLAPDAVLARLFGLQESLVSLTVGLGAVVASLLINLASLPVAMVAVGALCPILVVATWRRLGRPDRNIGELDKEIGLLQGVPIAHSLPRRRIRRRRLLHGLGTGSGSVTRWSADRCQREGILRVATQYNPCGPYATCAKHPQLRDELGASHDHNSVGGVHEI